MSSTIYAITFAVLVVMGTVSSAHAEEQSKAWIFVTGPDRYCEENVAALEADIQLHKQYLPFIGEYQIVCFPSAHDVMNVREIVGLLRPLYPHDKFVFTYDLRNAAYARDFKLFLSTVDRFNHESALGKSFIEEGFAISTFSGEVAAHELSHLTTHKDHIASGTVRDLPATWK